MIFGLVVNREQAEKALLQFYIPHELIFNVVGQYNNVVRYIELDSVVRFVSQQPYDGMHFW